MVDVHEKKRMKLKEFFFFFVFPELSDWRTVFFTFLNIRTFCRLRGMAS